MTRDWGGYTNLVTLSLLTFRKTSPKCRIKYKKLDSSPRLHEAQIKKVAKALGKSQGPFLLKQVLINHHKDTFGTNYMDHAICEYDNEEELVEPHYDEQFDLAYLIKGNHQFIILLHDVVYLKGYKLTKATNKLQSLLDDPLLSIELGGSTLAVT